MSFVYRSSALVGSRSFKYVVASRSTHLSIPLKALPHHHTCSFASLSGSEVTKMSSWTRLIRFIDAEGQERLGQPVNMEVDVGKATSSGQTVEANLIEGSIFDGKVTDRKATVKKLLSPVSKQDCSLIRCLGLNFKEHAAEASLAIPEAPILFIKPRTALAGPGDLSISKAAQNDQLDYETELACVFAKDCKNVSEADALDYVLGFTGSNDVSVRKLQMQTSQWCFGKGFDETCPIGPCLVRTSSLNPDSLEFSGTLSGEVVQNSNTNDMIFSTKKAISFLSQGTTIEKGTVMLFGTPSGIGWTRSPKRIIQNGEQMEIWFEGGIGTLVNRFVYA